jgi:hypothetical protein
MSIFVELKENKTGTVEGVMFYNGKARVPKLKAQELIKKDLVWCEAFGKPKPTDKLEPAEKPNPTRSKTKKEAK